MLIMLSETFANQFSLIEIKPGKIDCPAALISRGDETSIPRRSTRMLRAMHIFVYHLPPPSLPQPEFILTTQASIVSKNLLRVKCSIEPPLLALGWDWHGLCLRTDRYWFGWHRCWFRRKGLAPSTATVDCAGANGVGVLPLGKNGPLQRRLYIKPQLRGRETETWVWGFSCFKSVQEGSFCGSRQISFTFLFSFLFVPLLLLHLAKLNQNAGSCFMWSCCARYLRQPQLWPRVAVKI